MRTFSITRVYLVDATDREAARASLDAALRTGRESAVTLDWESIRLVPTAPAQPQGWKETFRDQLLGPKRSAQQPAWKKS